jgi:protoporphyrinogen oxidase
VTVLAIDREYENTSMINNLLRKDSRILATIVFDHHKSLRRVPRGKSLVTAILCEPASQTLFDEPEDTITSNVLRDIDGLYKGFSNRLVFSKVYRWPYGALQLWPGSVRQQHLTRGMLDKLEGNLLFAGDGLYKSSLEVGFNTGIEAAKRMIDRLGFDTG